MDTALTRSQFVRWRIAIFAIFAQLRFEREDTYHAEFANATGLRDGDFVRIAGVEVGKVTRRSRPPG